MKHVGTKATAKDVVTQDQLNFAAVNLWPANPELCAWYPDPTSGSFGNMTGGFNRTFSAGGCTFIPPGSGDTMKDALPHMRFVSAASTYTAAGATAGKGTTSEATARAGTTNGGFMFEGAMGAPSVVAGSSAVLGLTNDGFLYSAGLVSSVPGIYFGWNPADSSQTNVKLYTCNGTAITTYDTGMPKGSAVHMYACIKVMPGGATAVTLINMLTGVTVLKDFAVTATLPANNVLLSPVMAVGTCAGTAAVTADLTFGRLVPYYVWGANSATAALLGQGPAGVTGQVQMNGGAGAFAAAANVLIDGGDLLFKRADTPATPALDTVKLFGRRLAGRMLPASVGWAGAIDEMQPAIWRQKIARWSPPGNSTTVPVVDGFNAFSIQGTATARNVATTNLFTRTRRLAYVTSGAAGAVAGIYPTIVQWTTGDGAGAGGFFFSTRFGFSDAAAVAGARAFIGMSSATAAPTNVEPNTLTNSVGVARLSTDANQLYIVYGGSAAQTAIALGANFPPMVGTSGVLYELTLFAPSNGNGVVYYRVERCNTAFFVEGVLTPATPGTQTPANTTFMGPRLWCSNNSTGLACGLDIVALYLETDY